MAMTESDGATASQKCDPYAVGFEECENFLIGEECAHTCTHTHALTLKLCFERQAGHGRSDCTNRASTSVSGTIKYVAFM